MAEAQAKYKDRLFSFIFGSEERKEWTLSLYNAVNGTTYRDASRIEITTIREALYVGMHNDVSFMISNEMNMYEQQSTYNPNMPLRMLQYAGSLYEKDITERGKNKYGKSVVKLPTPKLVVFYNGRTSEPDERILRLSDAFAKGQREEADIEVRVRMVNVNKGHSARVMEACEPLMEYAWIVDRIRKLEKREGLEAAIGKAIDEMPEGFVLKPLMEAHRAEVKNMLLTEYDEAKTMNLFRKEGEEIGEKRGLKRGRQEGRREGRQEGEMIGAKRGRMEAYAQLSALTGKLKAQGRVEDALRAIEDPEFREKLFAEFQMA